MKELEENSKRLFSSKVSIIGLFAVLTLILTVPLVVLLSQEKQDLRGRAQETTAIPTKTPAVGSEIGFISGYVYLDANKNGEREAEEKPFPNASIKVTQIQRNGKTVAQKTGDAGKVVNTITQLKTDSLGFFKFRFSNVFPDSITYTVELELPDGYKTIATNPVIFSGMHKDAKETIEFGLFPITAATLPVKSSPTPRSERTQATSPQVCLDVITSARNTSTRVCKTFGNSCLPAGWIKDASCQISPTPEKVNSNSNSFPAIQGE